MKHLRTLKLAAAASVIPFFGAFAVDGDVEATASFRVALTVTQTSVLAFNATGPRTDFTGTPDTSEIIVRTDGTRSVTGGFYILPATGTATPGILEITGTPAETVNIACDDTAILSRGAGQTIVLSAIEIDTTGGVNTAATDCDAAGLTTPAIASVAIPGPGVLAVNIGGRIVANSGAGVSAGVYSTSGAGGDPVTLRVLYN
ncbi:MAG: DUF4402 domain-containing protein [Alphaproteobacteria bacterium]|nr:DUF4402 domain-containing protein [Alphaproteobacteria bacterium]